MIYYKRKVCSPTLQKSTQVAGESPCCWLMRRPRNGYQLMQRLSDNNTSSDRSLGGSPLRCHGSTVTHFQWGEIISDPASLGIKISRGRRSKHFCIYFYRDSRQRDYSVGNPTYAVCMATSARSNHIFRTNVLVDIRCR